MKSPSIGTRNFFLPRKKFFPRVFPRKTSRKREKKYVTKKRKSVNYIYTFPFFPTLPAKKAMKRPKQAAMARAMRRSVASESQPIIGGPTKKPKKLMLDTMVRAMLAFIVPNLPAML